MSHTERSDSSDDDHEEDVFPLEDTVTPQLSRDVLIDIRSPKRTMSSKVPWRGSQGKVAPLSSLTHGKRKNSSSRLLSFIKGRNGKSATRGNSSPSASASPKTNGFRFKPTLDTDIREFITGTFDTKVEPPPLKLGTVALLAFSSHLPARSAFTSSGKLLANGSYLMKHDWRGSSLPNLLDHNTRDVVEFGAVEYLAPEDSGVVTLTVVRRGTGRSAVTLRYRNVDIDIGESFLPQSGLVTLNPGQMEAQIEIEVASSPMWNPEGLMDVELSLVPSSSSSFALHHHHQSPHSSSSSKPPLLGDLRSCRVVLLDLNSFPYDVDDLEASAEVIVGFLMFLWSSFSWEVGVGLLLRTVPGLAFSANQGLTLYLIEAITDASTTAPVPQNVQATILFYAGGFFIVFLAEMLTDYVFANLRLKGKARSLLRTSAVDTVLQLSPAYHESYDPGKVMKVVDGQLDGAVAAFLTAFDLFSEAVKLVFTFLFATYLGVQELRSGSHPVLVTLMITVPIFMFVLDVLLLFLTAGPASRRDYAAMEADDDWTSFLVQATFMKHVVTNFRKGFAVTSAFAALHKDFNSKVFAADTFNRGTAWFAGLFPKLCEAIVAGVVGVAAARGLVSVATFVVFLSTITKFGPTIGATFKHLVDVNKGYAAMKMLSQLLNSDTRRRQLLRGQELRQELIQDYRRNPANHWDPEALIMHQLQYSFTSSFYRTLPEISCVIEAGQIVALRGPCSVGKNCLLRLLARHFVPSKGFVQYPANWRVRFVGDASLSFFGGRDDDDKLGTLEYNLKFGSQREHPDPAAWDVEIWNLLKLLWVTEDVIGPNPEAFAQGENPLKLRQIGLNAEKLSLTNRVLLAIARALLSSVDLLLLSNVLDLLPVDFALNVLSVLRELVVNRCLHCLEHENKLIRKVLRKKKLVIFSTKVAELENRADGFIALTHLNKTPPPMRFHRQQQPEKEEEEPGEQQEDGNDGGRESPDYLMRSSSVDSVTSLSVLSLGDLPSGESMDDSASSM